MPGRRGPATTARRRKTSRTGRTTTTGPPQIGATPGRHLRRQLRTGHPPARLSSCRTGVRSRRPLQGRVLQGRQQLRRCRHPQAWRRPTAQVPALGLQPRHRPAEELWTGTPGQSRWRANSPPSWCPPLTNLTAPTRSPSTYNQRIWARFTSSSIWKARRSTSPSTRTETQPGTCCARTWTSSASSSKAAGSALAASMWAAAPRQTVRAAPPGKTRRPPRRQRPVTRTRRAKLPPAATGGCLSLRLPTHFLT